MDEENLSNNKNDSKLHNPIHNVIQQNDIFKSNLPQPDQFNDRNTNETNLYLNDKPADRLSEDDDDDGVILKQSSRKLAIIDSDSEEENLKNVETTRITSSESGDSDTGNETQNLARKRLKRITKICSDSDDENQNEDKITNNLENATAPIIYTVNKEGELVTESNENIGSRQGFNLTNLCDSESSDEDRDQSVHEDKHSDNEINYVNENNKKKLKKCISKTKSDKVEKMTLKKALEERKEIFSESQRRVRESRISLPYHKPKPRSIKEFMQNRPRFASALTNLSKSSSPSTAIKMTKEELELVAKKLEERKKEVLEFYKSESESESDHEINNETTKINDFEKVNENLDESKNSTNMEDITSGKPNLDENNTITLITNELVKSNDQILESDILKLEMPLEKDQNDIPIQPLNHLETDKNESISNSLTTNKEEMDCAKIKTFVQNGAENITQLSEIDFSIDHKNAESYDLVNFKEDDENKDKISNKDASINVTFNDNLEKSIEITDKTINIIANVVIRTNNQEQLDLSDDNIKNNSNDKIKYTLDEEWEDYEFNLDDIDDESEPVMNTEKLTEKTVEPYAKISPKNSFIKKKIELMQKLSVSQPRLSGGPNEIIDLETGSMKKNDILSLKERFIKHNLKPKHQPKKKIEASVIRVNHGEILKEKVAINADEEAENKIEIIEKPGVRLQKLRHDLEHEIIKRRSELWQDRINHKNEENEELASENDEKTKQDYEEILDDEEEDEFTDEDELTEDDCDMTDKDKKSVYFDDEAEVSDDENEENQDNDKIENQIDGEKESDIEECESSSEENETNDSPKEKKLKRIIKPFSNEDSDEDGYDDDCTIPSQIGKRLGDNKIDRELSAQNIVPLGQATNYTGFRKPVTPVKEDYEFLTPINNLTGLQELYNTASKITENLLENKENKCIDSTEPFHRNLFDSNDDLQDNIEDSLEMLCSGKFPQTQDTILSNCTENEDAILSKKEFSLSPKESICTQDLINICSGNFTNSENNQPSFEDSSKTPLENNEISTQDLAGICSGQFTGLTNAETLDKSSETCINLEEKETQLISQLIDEEEMERFKKKFESPLPVVTHRKRILEEEEQFHGGGIIESDDDDEGGVLKIKKKNKIRITFSDEDDDDEQEETIDLQDDYAEDEYEDIAYDSEENEVVQSEHIKQAPLKLTDFLENEAELSDEEEQDSGDEDDNEDLDVLEFEAGDNEKFDENEMRADIERVQMRQMLDEDNKEVKLLQEMLLEDGELHGAGRQRQFRWKNMDSVGEDATDNQENEDNEIYLEEDEEESQWRKIRHEREMFLLQKHSQEETVDEVSTFKHKTVIKDQNALFKKQSSVESPLVQDSATDFKFKESFSFSNKRGSFLSRSEQILQRYAEASTKISTGITKNSKKIVFHSIQDKEIVTKRKAADDTTPKVLKKIRLNNLSQGSNLSKKKSTANKSLFSNL